MKLNRIMQKILCGKITFSFLSVAILILTFSLCGADKAFGSYMIFDGMSHKTGKGYALPRGISKFELSTQNSFSGGRHLTFDLQFNSAWTGCGWNWDSWNYDSDKIDVSKYSKIIFYLSLSPCSINDMTFQLTSATQSGKQDGFGKKVSIFPFIKKRDKYTKIEVDIAKLDGLSLDLSKVWGFNIGVFAGKAANSGKCRIYIDNIELIP